MNKRIADEIFADLAATGYSYLPEFAPFKDEGRLLLKLLQRLGIPFVPPGKMASFPFIVTSPSRNASITEPFNRAERIGWHNDFSTFSHRPMLSLSWIAQSDPAMDTSGKGSWMVAGSEAIMQNLQQTPTGRSVARFLSKTLLPFCYESNDHVLWATVIDDVPHRPGKKGIRFYRRSIFEGCRKVHGVVPQAISDAVSAIELAADSCGIMLPAVSGALLICHNWHCMHDRTEQSTESVASSRVAYLAFVDKPIK
jgi:hypothetical protein